MSEPVPQWRSTRALRAHPPIQGPAHATHAFPRNVVLTGEQLALDLDAAMHDEHDPHARIREAVAEPGMSPTEIDAAVRDALAHRAPVEALSAPACTCTSSMVFVSAFAEDRVCARCGRSPRP